MTWNERKAAKIKRAVDAKFNNTIRVLMETRAAVAAGLAEVQMLQFEDNLNKSKKKAFPLAVKNEGSA